MANNNNQSSSSSHGKTLYHIPCWVIPDKEEVHNRTKEFVAWYRKSNRTLPSPSNKCMKVKDMSHGEVLEKIREEKKRIEDGCSFELVDQSASNKIFDDGAQRLVLKDGKKLYKPQKATKEAYGRVLNVVSDICEHNKPRTLRDIFYTAPNLFRNQSRSNKAVNQLCCEVGCNRTSLNVIAGDRGFVIGPFTFRLDGRPVDCNSEFGPNNKVRVGQIVPPYISSVSNMKNNGAKFVLVVESVSVYQRLTVDNFHNDYKCIIMTGKGMSDLALREFAKYIMDTFEIPIFLLSDSDPWGIEIYAVFKYGSESMAFDSENLANPLVYWLGVWPTDLTTLKIPSEKLSCKDRRKAKILLKKEFVTSDEMLVNQLDHMVISRKKAGILALNNFGPVYGLSDYLLYKLYKVMGDIMEKGKI
ncbi:DNA topoisomerase 6 subunit A [Rosa sericea]